MSIERFAPLVGKDVVDRVKALAASLRARAADRVVWNVSSTAVGGGVAEMLPRLIAYVRGTGIDARWVVITGAPEFFRVTKRIHNALHGEPGDGSPLDEAARAVYETTIEQNAQDLLARVRPRDVVILHDPQTIGLAPYLERAGAVTVWRCHIGTDQPNEQSQAGWAFLRPYLQSIAYFVFSRLAYAPEFVPRDRIAVIAPSIDPFAPKNEPLGDEVVRAILCTTGLVATDRPTVAPIFTRNDGTPGRVDRAADMMSLGGPPPWDVPLIVQVSRWDMLKDPLGVMDGFARLVARSPEISVHLMLAGPNVRAVADDPDGARVFDEVATAYRRLPHHVRRHVHLANLPTADVEENAAIVNALQRHAAIIVQKSLREGFGLTVTEAMWKGRPIIASAVGGIVDQVADGVDGLLLKDPRDLDAFAAAMHALLSRPELARSLGEHAAARARERFLGLRHLIDYGMLLDRIDSMRAAA
jgi:trehalose synthase